MRAHMLTRLTYSILVCDSPLVNLFYNSIKKGSFNLMAFARCVFVVDVVVKATAAAAAVFHICV